MAASERQGGHASGGGRRPLRAQIRECQAEWFEEELQEASGGNPVSMALVGQMLMQGYGCTRDLQEGKRWVAKALETAQGKEDYAHLLGGWRSLLANADKQPVIGGGGDGGA